MSIITSQLEKIDMSQLDSGVDLHSFTEDEYCAFIDSITPSYVSQLVIDLSRTNGPKYVEDDVNERSEQFVVCNNWLSSLSDEELEILINRHGVLIPAMFMSGIDTTRIELLHGKLNYDGYIKYLRAVVNILIPEVSDLVRIGPRCIAGFEFARPSIMKTQIIEALLNTYISIPKNTPSNEILRKALRITRDESKR